MDGVMAPIDGRWQAVKGATLLVRRLDAQAEEPPLGTVLARRHGGGLGAAAALAARLKQAIGDAGGEPSAIGELLGEGAPWIGKAAAPYCPGVRQTLDSSHLSAHLDAFAHLQHRPHPLGAKAWVEQNMGALLTDHVGEGLRALRRMRPWQQAGREALPQLLGDGERNRTCIRSQAPWPHGLAVGSGAVEGAGKPVVHRRFKRAGRRWKQPGFLHVLALRSARLNPALQAFWASRGLMGQDLR
jgi:hypothetical protein